MPDGMPAAPPAEPLRIVKRGIRYGVVAPGQIAWLPASMWPHAAAFVRHYEADMAFAERMQKLWEQAQDEALDAVTGAKDAG